jgi:hypothetical protein
LEKEASGAETLHAGNIPLLVERVTVALPDEKEKEKGEGRREKGEGRREKGEGRREKGEGRREKGEGSGRRWGRSS